MTSTPVVTNHGGTDLDVPGDGGPNPRCHWDETVCTRTPDRVVVFAVASDGPDDDTTGADAEPFCARHYVLTLARLLDLHLPTCPGSARQHVLRFGPL